VENGYPTSELWNQLDAMPPMIPFVRKHIEVSRELERALDDLLLFLDTTVNEAWGDEFVSLQHPEWERIRIRAAAALTLM
jgi:hypothetical protein